MLPFMSVSWRGVAADCYHQQHHHPIRACTAVPVLRSTLSRSIDSSDVQNPLQQISTTVTRATGICRVIRISLPLRCVYRLVALIPCSKSLAVCFHRSLSITAMASPASASASASASPWSPFPSSPSSSLLLRLPAVLLPNVCSYLRPHELLITLAQAARTTRERLTPACFSSHDIELSARQLSILASLAPDSSLSLRSFHCRVLCECRLSTELKPRRISMQQLLDALSHFPTCKSVSLDGGSQYGRTQLLDIELHALLHHPIIVACRELNIGRFERPLEEGELYPPHNSRKPSMQRPFSWATVRLPSATRLSVLFTGGRHYSGVGQFLTAHTALLELSVSTQLVPLDELVGIFHDPAALPQLTHLSLSAQQEAWRPSLRAVVTALATTAVGVSGRPRPMTQLILNMPTPQDVFPAAALMPALTRLEIRDARLGWLAEWTNTQAMLAAWPQLEELVVHADRPQRAEQDALAASLSVADMQPFLQSMACRPLRILRLRIGERVTCSAAAMAELARCQQLRQLALDFSAGIYDEKAWMDWTDASLFAFVPSGCLSRLHSITLQLMKLSAAAVLAIASAAPQLRTFSGSGLELSCHPAILCAIIGGCCEHIEEVSIDDVCCHVWRGVQAEDVAGAYQSAVAAAGRGSTYRPFTQLRRLRASMCWCTPASAWHALLSLLRWAVRLQGVAKMSSDDPLLICALSYLPSITELGADCLWPRSFAELMERKSEESGQYCFVTADELCGRESGRQSPCCACSKHRVCDDYRRETGFELSGYANGGLWGDPVPLLPHSDLFAVYQRSLTDKQQAVLARWATGDFHAGDGQVSAADAVEMVEEEAASAGEHPHCPRPPLLVSRYAVATGVEDEASDEEISDEEAEEASDDEM